MRLALLRDAAPGKGCGDSPEAYPAGTGYGSLQFALPARAAGIRQADGLLYQYAGYDAEHRL